MSRKAMKSSLALTIMGLLLLGYTNCSAPKVNDAGTNPYGSGSDSASSSGYSLGPINKTISWGESLQIQAAGGVYPYYFRLKAGSGSVDTYSGMYSAPNGIDTDAVIEVQDTAGRLAEITVLVRLNSSGTMSLTYSPAAISVNTQVTLTASGGTAPYRYFMYSGVGTVSGNKYTANSFGTATIGVEDAAGLTSTFNLTVSSQSTITTKTIYRLYHSSGKQYLYSASQTEGTTSGFAYEAAAFKVLTTQLISTSPLYRCYIASQGARFLSTSPCTGYTNEGTLGYIYAYREANTAPLYNCFKASTNSYLTTTDYASCINNGFNVVGQAIGHVPL